MTVLQKLQIRQSEIRESINSLLGLETRTEEQDAELVKLTSEGTAIEPEIRAAIVAEPDPNETRVEGDAETRELRQLTERANVGDILSATFEKRQTSGEAAELQKHFSLGSHQIPLEMLRINRSVEERAAATVPASIGDASQAPVDYARFCQRRRRVFGYRAAHSTRRRRIFPGFVHPSSGQRPVHRFD